LKLAVVRQRYNPYGGAERFVSRAAAALTAQGASVTVVARDWTGAEREAQWLRCDPFYVGRIWRDASFARAACDATATGFDLVQSHERIACCDLYRAGDGVHAQWLEHRARLLTPLRRLALRAHPYHRYVLAAERRLFASPRLKAVICNSRMVRDEVEHWFGVDRARLHVIHNGVDLDAFHPRLREHRAASRRSLGLHEADRVVLFVGAGFERKGVAQLLRALARSDAANLHLVVVGKDRAEGRMRELARRLGIDSRVHWVGPQRDVRPYYGCADCFALPTFYDPFPNAALEALASGLPVVTTTACGAAELVEPGVSGYVLSDASDASTLAGCLQRAAVASPAMGEAARAAAEPYGLEAMASRLVALYKVLIAKQTGRPA
jgi:UDP-glucose:(heptosyl)LPS alpha-1,3-glucosyltransferase